MEKIILRFYKPLVNVKLAGYILAVSLLLMTLPSLAKPGKDDGKSGKNALLITTVDVVGDIDGAAISLDISGINLCQADESVASIVSLPNAFSDVTCSTLEDQDLVQAALMVPLPNTRYLLVVDASNKSGEKGRKSEKNPNTRSSKVDQFEFTCGIRGEQESQGEPGPASEPGARGDAGAQGIADYDGTQGIQDPSGITPPVIGTEVAMGTSLRRFSACTIDGISTAMRTRCTPAPIPLPAMELANNPQFNDHTLASLVAQIGQENFEHCRTTFLNKTKERMACLFAEWVRRDLVALTSEAHTMSSNIASYGGDDLAWPLRKIETASQGNQIAEVITYMKDIEAASNVMVERVSAYSSF